MAGEINVGTVETVLTLLDQMSGPLLEATKALEAHQKAQGKTQEETKKTGDALTVTGMMFANWATKYILQATDAIIGFAKESVTAAAEVKMLGHVAEFMGEKVGLSAKETQSLVAGLNAQGITLKQSNDTVIQFVKSNLDLSKATQLAALAQSAARVGNMNSSAALQRLIHGIQTQQTETLRTVGITISMEKATQEYARSIGKTADQLSASEKQQAAFNAVLKEGEKINGVYNVTMKDAAGKWQSMTRLIADAKVAIGMQFQPAWEKAVDLMYDFWKAVGQAPEKFTMLAGGIALVGTAMKVAWVGPWSLALTAVYALIAGVTGVRDPLEQVQMIVKALGDTMSWLADTIKFLTAGVVDFKLAFANIGELVTVVKIVFDTFLILVAGLGRMFTSLASGVLWVVEAFWKLKAATAPTDALQKDAQSKVEAIAKMREGLAENIKSLEGYQKALKDEREALIAGETATKTHTKSKEQLKKEMEAAAAKAAAFKAAADKKAEAEAKAAAETQRHTDAVKALSKTLTDAGIHAQRAQSIKDIFGAMPAAAKMSWEELQRFTAELRKIGGPEAEAAIAKVTTAFSKANGGIQILTTNVRKFNELASPGAKYQTEAEKVSAAAEKIKKDLDAQDEQARVTKLAFDQLYANGLISASQYDQYLATIAPKTEKVAETTNDWTKALAGVVQGATLLASLFGGSALGEIANVIGASAQATSDYRDQMKDLNERALKPGITETEKAAIAQEKFEAKIGLASAAAGMLGSALSKSTNATVAQAGAALQGAAAGAKMGASFGPIGAAAGAAIGGIMGFINAGKKMKAEVEKMYTDFVKAAGGIDALKKSAADAGVSLEEVMKNKGTKNVEAMKKAIADAKDKMDAFKSVADKVGVSTMKELEAKAKAAGISMKAVFDAKTVEEYKSAMEAVGKQFDTLNEANQKLNSAMEKYGITIDQLGPKMRQQKLDEQAMGLFEDWQLLIGAGVDMNVLIEKMGPNMMEYVNTAVTAGATIPQAMKPAIDAMYEQGKLIHENGQAYTQAEYEALKYGTTQAEMFDKLIEKITTLVNALLGIPQEVNTTVTTTHREVNAGGGGGGGPRNHDGSPDEDGDPTNSFRAGSGGFRDFGMGTAAVLHGTERVQTAAQYQQEQQDIAGAVSAAIASQTSQLAKVFRDAVLKGV